MTRQSSQLSRHDCTVMALKMSMKRKSLLEVSWVLGEQQSQANMHRARAGPRVARLEGVAYAGAMDSMYYSPRLVQHGQYSWNQPICSTDSFVLLDFRMESPRLTAIISSRLLNSSLISTRAKGANLCSGPNLGCKRSAYSFMATMDFTRAYLRVSLMGQSRTMVSSTTTCWGISRGGSLAVSSVQYLEVSSWPDFLVRLLCTSPKTQQAPLATRISTMRGLLAFMAIFRGELSHSRFTEIFTFLSTYSRICGSPEYTAVCTTEQEFRLPVVFVFICFYLKQSISSRLPYLTAYRNGFQLLGEQKLLSKCGNVSKNRFTSAVLPDSAQQHAYRSSRTPCSCRDAW